MARTRRKKTGEDEWFIERDARQALFEMFKELKDKVVLQIFTKKGENEPYNDATIRFARDLAKLSSKIEVNLNSIGDAQSKKYVVTRSPTVLINPEEYRIRYTGAPAGEEGRSFVETIMLMSHGKSGLSKASREMLSKLSDKRNVQVFVSLACPYCPGQVLNAFRAAIEKPDVVSAECVDSNENVDLAKEHNVGSVPHTMINGKTISLGFEPEERFISELVTLEPAEEWAPSIEGEIVEADLIIVGAGPAGLTAGIYAGRSGLNAIVLEKETIGGQVLVTPSVENYPGFDNIAGKKLMEMISSHAKNYVNVREGEEVSEIKIGKNIEAITNRACYVAKALILATGARYRKLRVPGEDRFSGHGVSYCATCDGHFYKGKDVIVVGGGNTALTDALYLKSLGASVRIVHRRDQFRAEKYLQESVKKENIPVIWDSLVEEILGKDELEGMKLKNTKDNTTQVAKTDGVFVSIGEVPNTQLATEVGIELSDSGFIKVDRKGKTNIPRIYAAGDVTGAVRQIVTAVGEGAAAAMSAFEGIFSPYWLATGR